jgi:hypothetical protein
MTNENQSCPVNPSVTGAIANRHIAYVRWARIFVSVLIGLSTITLAVTWVRGRHATEVRNRMEKPLARYRDTLAALGPFISDKARKQAEADEQPYLTAYTAASSQEKVCWGLTYCTAGIVLISLLFRIFSNWRYPGVICVTFSICGLIALFAATYLARFRATGGWAALSDEKTPWMALIFCLNCSLVVVGAVGVWAAMKWRVISRKMGSNSDIATKETK